MITNIKYYFLLFWVKLYAILPMNALYILSDILYIIVYRLIGYRVKVARANIKAAFPEKSDKERETLERKFYHHFSDYIVETIKIAHISREELNSRAVLNNPEMIDKLMDEGHPCIIMLMGHYGNWEWFCATGSYFKEATLRQVYRPLNDKAVDRLFIYLRNRFGAKGIKKNDTIRDVLTITKNNERSCVVLISDQTPSPANIHYWTTFLNQDTPILVGAERIATKMNIPVVYSDVRKVGRGRYTVDFRLITDTPREMPEYRITEEYTRMMEETILREPAYWLWTHKRWKHKR
jgi:Lauroyl/myristoyl acyltransferase